MRKYDIFGKKIAQNKTFYIVFLMFILLVGSYYAVMRIQQNRLDDLIAQEANIQRQINQLLATSNVNTYHEIGEIIQYLPNQFDQSKVHNELEYVRNVSGLSIAQNYQVAYNTDSPSPFTGSLPSTVKFVRIAVSFESPGLNQILDYIDYLYDLDTLYYVSQLNVARNNFGGYNVSIIIHTFYNDVNLG